MSKRGRGGGGKSGGISWNKQKAEPKFIREFKERIAYKEQASVESKVRFHTKMFKFETINHLEIFFI